MTKFPAVKCAVVFICGILLNDYLQFNYTFLLTTTGLLIVVFTLSYFTKKILHLLSVLLFYLVIIQTGSFTAEVNKSHFNLLPEEIIKEENFTVFGKIESISLIGEKEVSFVISADSFSINNFHHSAAYSFIGKFRNDSDDICNALYQNLQPGYKIIFTGTFTKGREKGNPGEFDYNKYLRDNGISGLITTQFREDLKIIDYESDAWKSAVFNIRKAIDGKIRSTHNSETASLLRGLLLADRSGIEYEKQQEFIDSGVMHVLAVSGLHTGYIALIFLLLFGRFKLVLRSVLTIAGLLFFLFITGIPVSVFRAVVMSSLIIFTILTCRTTNIFNSLAVAAVIILICYPGEIYNPGFQLSFSAVLSIAVIYPMLRNFIYPRLTGFPLLRSFVLFATLSLAAQIGTLPITIYYFGKLSIIAIAANIIVIPLIGIIIATAIVTMILTVLFPFISFYYASANELFTSILFSFINLTANSGTAFLRINDFSAVDIVIFYFFTIFYLYWFPRLKLKISIILFVIAASNIILLTSLDNKELMTAGKFNLLMIDVGQGDACIMKFPDGTSFLIDAGEANKMYDAGERVIIPLLNYLNIKQVDFALITHLDLDHYGGLISLLNDKRIKHLFKPPADGSPEDKRLEDYLRNIRQSFSYSRNSILNFDRLKMYVLNNDLESYYGSLSTNDKSSVIKFVYGQTSFLFTGDIQTGGERYYTGRYGTFLTANVLKISHHGSKSSTSEEFINFVNQDFALISAGYKNRFNHPSGEVLGRLMNKRCRILRTDLNGGILLQSDGINIQEVCWKR